MITAPMKPPEISARIGVTVDTFYKNRQRYIKCNGMPDSIAGGKSGYDRASMEAWLTRYHPARPPRPVNDVFAVPDPATDEEHRARLALAYAPQKPIPALDTRRRAARG